MLAKLLPTDPDQRRLALRFALILIGIVLGCGITAWLTADTWPDAADKATRAGKVVRYEQLAMTWSWPGLAAGAVIAGLLGLTVRWWVGAAKVARATAPASRRFWILALFLLLVAAGLRAPRLGLSFYNDEAHNFVRLTAGEFKDDPTRPDGMRWRGATWAETLWYNRPGNNSQPHSLLTRLAYDAWRHATGAAEGEVCEWVVRLPAFFAGLASLLVLAFVVRRAGGEAAGLATLMAGSAHAWHVRYSTEARGYGLMILGIALSMLFLQRALEHGRWRDWLGYGFSTFLCIWAFPGCLYWVAALNGCLLVHLLWQWRNRGAGPEPVIRLLVAGVLAIMVALPLMLPLVPQLLAAVQNAPGLRGTMDGLWWKDVGSYLLFGCRWVSADLGNPVTLASERLLATNPNLWLAVANATIIAALGFTRLFKDGGAARLFVIAAVLAVVLGWADMARQGRYLNHWYLLYVLPVVLCAMGRGVTVVLSFVRLRGWQADFAILLISVVATRMTLIVTEECLHRPKGDERGPVVQARGAIYPHYLSDATTRNALLGMVWSSGGTYDPHALTIYDIGAFEALKKRATEEQRPLYIVMSHRHQATLTQPEVVKQLEGPGFEKVATFPALDEEAYTQVLFKLK